MEVISNTVPELAQNPLQHILLIRTDILNRHSDVHFVQTAIAFQRFGHRVTIVTCTEDPEMYHSELSHFRIIKTVTWIPGSIFGYFRYFMYVFRSLVAAINCVLFPTFPKPSVIFCNVSCIAIPILYFFGHCVIFHLQNPYELLQICNTTWKHAPYLKWIWKYSIFLAKEIMVPDCTSQKIFKKVFHTFNRKTIVCFPHVDLKLLSVTETCDVRKIVPRFLVNGYLFVCFGEYTYEHNFQLILNGFIKAMKKLDWNISHKMHLVIAGNYDKTNDEHRMYYNSLSNLINMDRFSQYITLLKEVTIVEKKCLMYEALAIVHTALNDVFSPTVLEAMFLGKPIIGTKCGFARDVLASNVTGFLLPPIPEAFSALIQKMVNNKILPLYVGTLAETEFKYKYSFSTYAEHLNKLIAKHCLNFCCASHCSKHRNIEEHVLFKN